MKPARVTFRSIGLLRTQHTELAATPIQPGFAVDMLDGTPLLDIKPYAPRYDAVTRPRGGWTEEVDEATARRRGRRQRDPSAAKPQQPLSSKQPATRMKEQ
jgi:tRNA (Thr-GGU) A37 N-methylase